MRLIIQRVTKASVEVENEIVGKISEGFMVLVGFGQNDTFDEVDYLTNKLLKLRIFPDDEDRMNLSLIDTDNQLLLVPQFTLYASTKKNRPSFHRSMNPKDASLLFDYFYDKCKKKLHVEKGVFGAHMNVELVNNGPVTIYLEKEHE